MRCTPRTAMVGVCLLLLIHCALPAAAAAQEGQDAALPAGVRAVWDMDKAYRQVTPTRERVCINGLWRFKPAVADDEPVPPPGGGWGYFKVPGPWPSGTDGDQTIYPAEAWKDDLRGMDVAWCAREIEIPRGWEGRRIGLYVEWLNSYARVFVDGKEAATLVFPGGEADITAACTPGRTHTLAIQVFARPLNRDYTAFAAPEEGTGRRRGIGRRGLVGDVFLTSCPPRERITYVKVDTSVRRRRLTLEAGLAGLQEGRKYALRARVMEDGREVLTARGRPFAASEVEDGRVTLRKAWSDPKLWDTDTPENQYDLLVELVEDERTADAYQPVRFGFREFWIDGRDFYLNGSRVHLRAVPLNSAQMGAAHACYKGAREVMERFRWLGFNTVYTHNYSCEPGSHGSFAGVLNAADDLGMLLCFSLPHMRSYDWSNEEAVKAYERHVEWYARQSQNHPSVIMYSQNHNGGLAFSDDQNPQRPPLPLREGLQSRKRNRVLQAWERERMLRQFDTAHPVYTHSGANKTIYTINCYLNWVPMQERAEWWATWAREGQHALFLAEYGEPLVSSYSSLRIPYSQRRLPQLQQYFYTEWGAQFRGDAAYELTEFEKVRLRWETGRWRSKEPFGRLDYPVHGQISTNIPNLRGVQAEYIAHTWPYFRTLGVSGFNIWHAGALNYRGEGVSPGTVDYAVDWDNLQRPGLSPDRAPAPRGMQYAIATERSDWPLNVRGDAIRRYNQPLLAYIAGKPSRFTAKGHNYLAGQRVEKQVIVVNDSRRPVECECTWTVSLPEEVNGTATLRVEPGENGRQPIRFYLPDALEPGQYEISIKAAFDTGEVQEHSLAIHVLPPRAKPNVRAKAALFDTKGETAKLMRELGVPFDAVKADADLSDYDLLVIGKESLTVDGPAPDLSAVRDGLKVIVFEQTSEALEKRLGFRVAEYGLRRAFPRVPGHPVLEGLSAENLRDWHGEATLVPPAIPWDDPNSKPTVDWCGFKVIRPGRAGCYGTISSVTIEKPARGDFLPIVDNGFALQYSSLLLYREGKGLVAFCQMDVTGRTDDDPAASRLVANLLQHVDSWRPAGQRSAVYAGEEAGLEHLKAAGADVEPYHGQPLASDRVLVLGPGATEQVAAYAGRIASWVKGGGQVLALGLSQQEARALLPSAVTLEEKEHISCVFDPAPAGTALAGVGCGDLMIRDPRVLPLVVAGPRIMGDGVLARAEDADVTFLQLVPWHFDYEELYNTKMAFKGTSFATARLLANMGVAFRTPLLDRFASPLVLPPEPPEEAVGRQRLEREDKAVLLARRWRGLPLLSGGEPEGWTEPGFDDSAWRSVTVPGTWESQFEDLAGFDGVFLYRLTVEVPAEFTEGETTLVLGAVDDEDRTYVNGRFVGSVTRESNPRDYWVAARRYRLAPGTLKAGQNVIAIEVKDVRQSGGLMGFETIEDVVLVHALRENRRWLDGLYLDEPVKEDDPYRYYRW